MFDFPNDDFFYIKSVKSEFLEKRLKNPKFYKIAKRTYSMLKDCMLNMQVNMKCTCDIKKDNYFLIE